MEIRRAQIEDGDAIIDIMLRTWRTTYSGLMDESIFAEREADRPDRIIRIKNAIKLSLEYTTKSQYCVAVHDGRIIGYSIYGRYRNNDNYAFDNTGEVYAVYVLKEYQRHGAGKQLVHHAVSDFMATGYQRVVIWCLKDNPSRGFYEKMGGEGRLNQELEMGIQILQETGFVFDDIYKLYENTKSDYQGK